MTRGDPVAWQPFVAASLLLAISAGFGLGGLLMAAAARHAASGRWWEAAAQAHGYLQVFGWAGLMVLGVGLHMLPRLRGAPLAHAAWARPACALLVTGLALLLGGLALRAAGDLAAMPLAGGLGRLTLAAALVLGIVALGVFGRRRPLPRAPAPLTDPVRVQMLSAYVWLLVVTALLILDGLDKLGVIGIAVDPDAERHALGAGFVTLLILGVGAFLLPGMTGRRRLSWELLWATAACANVAALLRVASVAVPGLLPGASGAEQWPPPGCLG